MKESVITVNFDVESEAYQALSEIKRHPDGSGYFVSAASLIKKENGHIVLKDGFDTEMILSAEYKTFSLHFAKFLR